MPGTPRKPSESGFYHVVIKGNNGRILFEDDLDRTTFLELVRSTKDKFKISYHAWCLMSNHVHLLVEDPNGNLSRAMSLLSRGYTEHYRMRHGHEGSLYSGRFWSEPIENEGNLLCVARYIHHNPQAAGICATSQYRWSSIHEYLREPDICTTALLLNLCNGIEGFVAFHREAMTATSHPGSRMRSHATDQELLTIARALIGTKRFDTLASMSREDRDPLVSRLYEAGFSTRTIARLSGISERLVKNARNAQ